MSDPCNTLLAMKNHWLSQQVDVEFPTKESLEGRALYLSANPQLAIEPYIPQPTSDSLIASDQIFLVDFHRLTIMFAQLQASRWSDPAQQALVIEFLTQIIYSKPCELYLAFVHGEAVAGAIVTYHDKQRLISDLACKGANPQFLCRHFSARLAEKLQLSDPDISVYVEALASE